MKKTVLSIMFLISGTLAFSKTEAQPEPVPQVQNDYVTIVTSSCGAEAYFKFELTAEEYAEAQAQLERCCEIFRRV